MLVFFKFHILPLIFYFVRVYYRVFLVCTDDNGLILPLSLNDNLVRDKILIFEVKFHRHFKNMTPL